MKTQANILIVDDKPANLHLLMKLLSESGYTVRPAPSGKHALAVARDEQIDLLLLDILMPEMDGYDVCRRLKAQEATRDIPIIFLSALNDPFDKVKAFEIGGVDYITKPFQEEEVLARVQTHLTIQQLHQQLQEENDRFHVLEEATSEGILIHAQARILEVNSTLTTMFDYARQEMIDRSVLDFVPPLSQAVLKRQLMVNDELPYEIEGVKKDGTIFPIEFQGRNMGYHGRQVRVMAVRDLTRQKHIERENLLLKEQIRERYRFGPIIGKSPAMQRVYELVDRAAATNYGVIVYGESGTGKELVAKTIHDLSARKEPPFISVNCGAVLETLFEQEFFGHRRGAFTGADHDAPGFFDAARRGTLFLDEVVELSPAMQVKLLRVLENGEYIPVGDTTATRTDVRLIAATNQPVDLLLQQGKMREDFFYRIHVIAITMPPLRERREDIPLLIEHLLQQESSGHTLSSVPLFRLNCCTASRINNGPEMCVNYGIICNHILSPAS